MKNLFLNKSFLFLLFIFMVSFVFLSINYTQFINNYTNFANNQNQTELLEISKDAIYQLYILIVILCSLFTYLIYILKNKINELNENLDENVEKRTKQLHHSMKELEKVNLKLYDLAHTDYLTQIKNRRSFFLHADNLLTNIKKRDEVLSIIMIDIDNFKNINDTHGHEVGDTILIEFTKTINEAIDSNYIFGRLGGEEFAIVVPYANIEKTEEIAENLRKAIENLRIFTSKITLKITASFGVHDSTDCNSIDDIISYADKKLYSAKSSGKNRVRARVI